MDKNAKKLISNRELQERISILVSVYPSCRFGGLMTYSKPIDHANWHPIIRFTKDIPDWVNNRLDICEQIRNLRKEYDVA